MRPERKTAPHHEGLRCYTAELGSVLQERCILEGSLLPASGGKRDQRRARDNYPRERRWWPKPERVRWDRNKGIATKHEGGIIDRTQSLIRC